MNTIPILTVLAVGLIGFILMAAAFILSAKRGGWQTAMQPLPDGRWQLPRKLMFSGAACGVLFGLGHVILTCIPGGVPWLD